METEVKTFIGLDIGGTGNKISILSQENLGIELGEQHQVSIGDKKYQLVLYSCSEYEQFWGGLQNIKKKIKGKVQLVGTGGGGFSKTAGLSKLFQAELKPINQFDANAKGMEFHKKTNSPIRAQTFQKNIEGQIKVSSKETTLKEYSDYFIFISLGSGVNWQIFGEGDKGIERKKVNEKVYDDFIMDGTNLGAGFLMGLGKMLTQEKDYPSILAKMRKDEEFVEFYDAIWINLFQISFNMTFIHNQKNILMSGTVLKFIDELAEHSSKALEYIMTKQPVERTVLRLQKFEGFTGALGALSEAMS